jgi:hypothetical protein
MLQKLGSAHTLVVNHKTALYNAELKEGLREVQETLYFRYPDRFRSEIRARGLLQVRVVDRDNAITAINGEIVGEGERPFDHFKDLFLYKEIGLLIKELSRLGINLQRVSLGRFDEKICYVIGGEYPDVTAPQVWIDKRTFVPVRLILRGASEGSPLREIEYANYRTLKKGIHYPENMLFFENGTLVRMHSLETAEIDPPLPEELFDLTSLKPAKLPMVGNPSDFSTPQSGTGEDPAHNMEEIFE